MRVRVRRVWVVGGMVLDGLRALLVLELAGGVEVW